MTNTRRRGLLLAWLVPVGLFLLAVVVRLAVATQLPFPTTEPSAYYVNVAENIVAGNGLVSDSVWSYATGPLVVPKPAFELWLPMSSFISALAMTVLGSGFWAAQVGGALLGALVAPLTWAIARESAHAQGLDERRAMAVAIASGLLAAVLAPFVLAAVVPDSYTPYLIFMLIATLLIPRVLGVTDGRTTTPTRPPSVAAGLALGAAMGLAYLSRQEVIWLGLTVLLMLWWVLRAESTGSRLSSAIRRLWPVFVGGLVVVVPWLVRNARDLGSPFPGQAIENAFLTQNEDIFAFGVRPNLATYLDQGLSTVVANPLLATVDAFINVIAVTAFPIGVIGLIALVGLRRSPALRPPSSLLALLISGALTFVSTVLIFPVATLWGTFLHASGPLLVGLTVASALGGDALLARISKARKWDKPNVIVGPIALLAVALLLATLQILIFSRLSETSHERYETLAAAIEEVAAQTGEAIPDTIITDHPMWLASVLDRSAIALPDEDLESILALSGTFEAPWMVVVGERGPYPDELLRDPTNGCLAREPVALPLGEESAWLFMLDESCWPT